MSEKDLFSFEVQDRRAVAKALSMLDLVGAKYVVQWNGKTFGELTAAQPTQRRKYHKDMKSMYLPILQSLQPGDSHTFRFTLEEREKWERLRKLLPVQCGTHVGVGEVTMRSDFLGNEYIITIKRHQLITE